MAIRKFSSKDRENDFEYRSLEIDSKMYSYLKFALYILAMINFKNTNIWASLMMITSLFSIVETVQKNKVEEKIKSKKFNKSLIVLHSVIIVLCLVNLFLHNVIK